MCQADYQNNWQVELEETWTRCSWFNNELDDTDTKVYYLNLVGGAGHFNDAGDQNYMEAVNLLWINTHGGAWVDTATWVMWDQNSRGFSKNVRLGDEGVGLSMLVQYACATMKWDGVWARWGSAFRGGLRYVMGSHDTLWDSSTTNEVGEDFADNIQGSQEFKYAWRDAVTDWNKDQDASVFATGKTSSECANRRDGMKWQNYGNYPRLKDSDVVYICKTSWENL
jgi:hypothetical protein